MRPFEKRVPTQVEEFYLVLLAVLFFSVLIMNVFIGVICVPWCFYLPGRIEPAIFFPGFCKCVKERDMISTSSNLRSFCTPQDFEFGAFLKGHFWVLGPRWAPDPVVKGGGLRNSGSKWPENKW